MISLKKNSYLQQRTQKTPVFRLHDILSDLRIMSLHVQNLEAEIDHGEDEYFRNQVTKCLTLVTQLHKSTKKIHVQVCKAAQYFNILKLFKDVNQEG
jgi:hypothetical protein